MKLLKVLVIAAVTLLASAHAQDWTLFAPLDAEAVKPHPLTECPAEIGGVQGKKVELKDSRYVDKEKTIAPGKLALFVAEIETQDKAVKALGFGANYFMKAYLNGKLVIDNWKYGNKPQIRYLKTDFVRSVELEKGKNILAVYVYHKTGNLTLGCGFVTDRDPVAEAPTREHFSALLENIPKAEDTAARRLAELTIQNGVADMRANIFAFYNHRPGLPEKELKATLEKHPVLFFYERLMDKLLKEIPATEPASGTVVIWHLYNMGYVVKTDKACFGIDINHRRAQELAPLLDFVLTTHKHMDHYNIPLLEAMKKLGKKTYSNFAEGEAKITEPTSFDIGDIHIETEQTDHNAKLLKFVTPYRITCGKGEKALVIYTTGDSGNLSQLNPAGRIDVHIVHPRVGINVPKATAKIHARYVFFSHLLEMGHCPPSPYTAVPYDWVADEGKALEKLGSHPVFPIWGEKFVFVNGELEK